MTVETPPPAEQPLGRRCPRCGAAMTDEQEWCLHCGAAVGTRIVPAPGWRTPIIIACSLLALAALAVAIAIVELADDADRVAQTPTAATTATPAPTPSPTATPSLTPDATTMPEASAKETPEPNKTSKQGSTAAKWPAGKSGWTVVLASDTSKSDAENKADNFAADGIAGVGVLHSNDFSSLKPGYWVVFAGQYDSQSEASDALDGIDAKDAYIRRVEPS